MQVVADEMSVVARRAFYQDGAVVVAVLGDAVRGAVGAGFAGERHAVVRDAFEGGGDGVFG